MTLPVKEYYSLAEVAERWGVPVGTIEDYLVTDRLQASIFLTKKMLFTQPISYEFDNRLHFDPYIGDECINVYDPDCYRRLSGIVNIIYQDIRWDEYGRAIILKGENCLRIPDEEGFFGLHEALSLSKDEIYITFSEINRFETENEVSKNVVPELISNNGVSEFSRVDVDLKKVPDRTKSLQKLVLAMAICHYRYKPSDKKSDSTALIQKHVERIGLSIDMQTIRDCLNESAARFQDEISID